jgi:S1-C subfamily serine protease
MEKQAIEHRIKLEEESRQRQREYEERRRQEALQKRQEEEARGRELARKKVEEERRLAIHTGTGFFVAPNGYLVTNNHVIDDTTDYAVRDFKGHLH